MKTFWAGYSRRKTEFYQYRIFCKKLVGYFFEGIAIMGLFICVMNLALFGTIEQVIILVG